MLYDNYFHEWKLIPIHLIKMLIGSKFKFHSNIFLKKHHLKNFLCSTEMFLLTERHTFFKC